MNPEILTDDQRAGLTRQFESDKARVVELSQHTRQELADYVHHLASTKPGESDLPRWAIYGWTLMDVPHYAGWSKRELIQRVLRIEVDDRIRATAEFRAKSRPAPSSSGPVKPPKSAVSRKADPPPKFDSGPVRKISESTD